MDEENVNITAQLPTGEEVDLRIPRYVTVKQLLHQLADAVEKLDIEFDPGAQVGVRVVNKGLFLADEQNLADYPVTNGDIIAIV